MLFGDPREYIMSIDPGHRVPLCTFVLQIIHQLRGAYLTDGPILMALAQIEAQVVRILASLLTQGPVASRFVAPPSP
jgi:hypothetical protein